MVLPSVDYQKIRVLVQKHLRAMSRTPAHITHVGNQELLDQLGVQEPGAYILRNMEGQLERWQANQRHIEPIPIKAKSDIGEWRCSVQQSLRDMLQKEHVAGRSLLQCPKCGLECANKTVLGSHMATAHAKGERPVFDRLRHSLGGRPRCSGCKELLSSWARLQKHIEHGACTLPIGDRMPGSLDPAFQSAQTQAVAPDPAPPDSTEAGHKTADAVSDSPLRFQQPVLDILKQHGWRGLLSDQSWRPKLAQWCCLCGTWCASNRAVKMHLARSHKDVWNPIKQRVESLCKTQTADITIPCNLCGSTSKEPRAHVVACPVIFESILLFFLAEDGARGGGAVLSTSVAGGEPVRDDTGAACGSSGGEEKGQNRAAAAGAQAQGQLCKQIQPEHGQGYTATPERHCQTDTATGGRTSDNPPCGFTWFVSTEPGGVLPVMFGVSSEWRKIQEQSPQQLKRPLHVIMMECIMAELRARLTKTSQEEAMKQAALQAGWVDQHRLWMYKSWDPVKKALTTMAKDPLSMAALDKIITEIQADLQVPGALHRFHASQPLKADIETLTEHKEVCFTIQVALRGQAAERLHQNMVQLCDNSVLRLLRSRLRPERKHRHGMAKRLADLMYNQPRA